MCAVVTLNIMASCQYRSEKWVVSKEQYLRKLIFDFQIYFIWISENTKKY